MLHLSLNYICNKLFLCCALNLISTQKSLNQTVGTRSMKQNYKKTTNNDYYFFLPSMNHFIFMEIQYIYQLLCPIYFSGLSIPILISHAIFNHHAYMEWVDQIISCKSSSFSIHDVAFRGTFPIAPYIKPNTCTNCFEVISIKVGFGNGGHCSVTINNLFHSHWLWHECD